jgi:peptidoglycan/xylan/chitin deacetylase (PgdA/CDA1 family)
VRALFATLFGTLLCLGFGNVHAAITDNAIVRSGPSTCHAIAITFDLCPVKKGSGFDQPLVTFLKNHQIHATFFPSGTWIAAHDAAIRELLDVPFFELGTHGETHASLPKLTRDGQRREIQGPVTTLATTYGRKTTLMRPPYGDYNDDTVPVAAALGLKVVLWSVVSGDPDPNLTAPAIERDVESRVRNGSVIIFHANGRGWHTPEIVADVYDKLVVGKGFTPMTVDELLTCNGRAAASAAH